MTPSPMAASSPSGSGIGPEDYITALTDAVICELKDMRADAHRSPKNWNDFLQEFVDDPDMTKIICRDTATCPSLRTVHETVAPPGKLAAVDHCKLDIADTRNWPDSVMPRQAVSAAAKESISTT
ncbi:hypothetical protein [Paracoccus albus]|uniref:hypothetical protein n=1 Tax=Paracoccus albus TaxID=3017784 RepID=UPI0022F0BBB5|nr:hypothetical protein [Paracoccus albus]WBU60840.1 hypothetical protein PAF20_02640 [Paracoccus albus]